MAGLTDDSLMPFGKYKEQPLLDVPDNYLIWIYKNLELNSDLKEYIEDSFSESQLK